MNLAQRLAADPPTGRREGPGCSLARIAASLDQQDADALMDLVYRRLDLSAPLVSEFLAADEEDPINLSHHIIQRHRRGECRKCPKRR